MRFGVFLIRLKTKSLHSTQRFLTAWRVQPRNYLLFACHLTNSTAQSINDARFVKYWYMGGREEKLGLAPAPASEGKVTEAVKAAREEPNKS